MKIMIDGEVLQFPATGISKSLLALYNSCLKKMPSLDVIIIHQKPLTTPIPPGLKSLQVGTKYPYTLWRHMILPLYVQREKPDFIHFPWNGNVPFLFTNTNVILTIHDVLPLSIPHYFSSSAEKEKYRKNLQKSINRSNLIFTVSKYSKKEIMKNFDTTTEPLVTYHGQNICTKSGVMHNSDGLPYPYFLYVGGYDPRKGIEGLLKMFLKLHQSGKIESKLVLTGSKNYFSSHFKKLVEKGVKKDIIIEKGYINEKELTDLYSNAKALIYPSKYEGFGLPPLEAMSCGCPVITTNHTSIPEVCGDAVYYCDVDDELDFASGIIEIEYNEKLRNELKLKGERRASQFSWSSSADLFLSTLLNQQNND